MKKRLVSLVLTIAMVLTLIPANILTASAATNVDPSTKTYTATDENDNGLNLTKSVKKNDDGTYTVTLEAYATGTVVTTSTDVDVPTDIVLVLDVSGSMGDGFKVQTGNYKPLSTLGKKDNDDVYNYAKTKAIYTLNAEGAYVPVSVSRPNKVDGKYKFIYSFDDQEEISLGNSSAPPIDLFYPEVEQITKLKSLKDAVNAFIDNVYAESLGNDNLPNTADDVDHKISIVKFSKTAKTVAELTSVKTGIDTLKGVVDDLSASGATAADYGMQNASDIVKAAYGNDSSRNRAIIMFTDGEPNHGSGFSDTVASNTIKASNEAKNLDKDKTTQETIVYTVGVFNSLSTKVTNYMQNVASNPSMFLNATDASSLSNVFASISQSVTNIAPAVKLDPTTVVKDIIADNFTLPDGADASSIKLYTANKTASGWEDKALDNSLSADVDGKTVSVNGFDFTANCVTDTVKPNDNTFGKKLIIEFNVKAEDDTFGGNAIDTNGTDSGVYNADGTLVENFPMPKADIDLDFDFNIATESTRVHTGTEVDLATLITTADGFVPDGTNNADVNIIYTINNGAEDVATFELPAGTAWADRDWSEKVTADKDITYKVICTVTPVNDSAYSTAENPVETEPVVIEKNATVLVYSYVNFVDSNDVSKKLADQQTVDYQQTATSPTPSSIPQGYKFDKWYTDKECTKEYDFNTPVVKDTTLYAGWEARTFTLKYFDGNTLLETVDSIVYDTTQKIKDVITKTGYTFQGWFDSLETKFDANSDHQVTFDDILATVENDVVNLYARWTANNYGVTVNYLEEGTNKVLAEQVNASATFGTSYTAADKAIEGYSCVTKDADKTIVIDAENNVIDIYYTPNNYDVTVNFLEEGTDKVLAEQVTESAAFASSYTAVAKDIIGYTCVSDEDDRTIVIDTENNVVDVYYRANNYDVTVNYLEKGTDKVLAEQVNASATFGTLYTADVKTITGYSCVTKDADKTITIAAKDNVINIYYEKNSYELVVKYFIKGETTPFKTETQTVEFGANYSVNSPAKPGYTPDRPVVSGTMPANNVEETVLYTPNGYNVTVNYLEEGTNKVLADQINASAIFGTTYIADVKPIEGYSCVTDTDGRTIVIDAKNNVINVYYKANDYDVTVNYLEEGTDKVLAEPTTESATFGTSYTADVATITGYSCVTDEAGRTITIATKDNVINVYYEANDYNLTVHYVDEKGNELVADHTEAVEFGTEYSVKTPSVEGYTPNKTSVDGKMPAKDVEETVTYKANNYGVTVNYLEKGTNKVLADPTTASATFGTSYTAKDKAIEGYSCVTKDADKTITIATNDNVINVYYEINKYDVTVNHITVETDKTQKTVDSSTTSVAYGDSFTAVAKDIDNYTFNPEMSNALTIDPVTGKATINLFYVRNTHTITIIVIDEDGNETKTEISVDEGSKYDVTDEIPDDKEGTTKEVTGDPTGTVEDDITIVVEYERNKYNLVIHYVYSDGRQAAEDYVGTVTFEDTYSVDSPAIANYKVDKANVSGTMPANDVEVTVTYSLIPIRIIPDTPPVTPTEPATPAVPVVTVFDVTPLAPVKKPMVVDVTSPLLKKFMKKSKLVELKDETPLSDAPNTGDESPIFAWTASLVASFAGAVVVTKRKKNEED